MRASRPHLHRLLIIRLSLVLAIGALDTARITGIEKAIDITATAFADQVSIVCWWTNAYRLGSTTKKITEIMSLDIC